MDKEIKNNDSPSFFIKVKGYIKDLCLEKINRFKNPSLVYKEKLNSSNKKLFLKVFTFNILLSLIFISSFFNFSYFENNKYELFYSSFFFTFIIIPLLFFCLSIPTQWACSTLGGKGEFLNYFKMFFSLMFSVFKVFVVFSIIFSLIYSAIPEDYVKSTLFTIIQASALFYSALLIKTVNDFTWSRTFFSILLILFFSILIYASSLILRS